MYKGFPNGVAAFERQAEVGHLVRDRHRDGRRRGARDQAVELGVTHIDTADVYGPHVTNRLIREALHPYPETLHIVTKVGATRDAEGGWPPAREPEALRRAVHENLESLGLEALDVVNLRLGNAQGPQPGSLAEAFGTLVELQQQGLIRHLGVSNATVEQVAEARGIAPIVCVCRTCTTSSTGRTTS